MRSFRVQVVVSTPALHYMLKFYIGTGGTVAGTGHYLRSLNPELVIAIADPDGSGLYNKVD